MTRGASGGPHRSRMSPRLAAVVAAALVLSFVACTKQASRDGLAEPATTERDVGSTTSTSSELTSTTLGAPPPFHPDPVVWDECDGDQDCATVEVPVDYHDPDGGSLTLALRRIPAGQPDERIGSLFLHPGGPGGSGIEFLQQAAQLLPAEVQDRFDLVGFDQRGVGESAPISCVRDKDELLAADASPDDDKELVTLQTLLSDFADACADAAGDDLPRYGTVEAARDLDALREAVGDDQLTYLGISYGTYLGGTYATLFPQNVRALVLDGAVDPTLGSLESLRQQVEGFELAFAHFAEACREDPECPVRPDPAEVYRDLVATAEKAPIPTSDDDGRTLTPSLLETGVIAALYARETWPALAAGLDAARNGEGDGLLALADAYADRDADGKFSNLLDANLVINCADSQERFTVDEARAAAADMAEIAPTFGGGPGWSLLSCGGFDPGTPPPKFDAAAADPIVVIGTTGDPATPFSGAEALTEALGSAVLVTFDGEGHSSFPWEDCVADAMTAYLVDLELPAVGLTCEGKPATGGASYSVDGLAEMLEGGGIDAETASCLAEGLIDTMSSAELTALLAATELTDEQEGLISRLAIGCASG